jgi:hypothetical protein
MTSEGGASGTVSAVCDQCAQRGDCITVGDAYVCDKCVAFHERALDHAAKALEPAMRNLAAMAIKAYCEFTDESVEPISEVTAPTTKGEHAR